MTDCSGASKLFLIPLSSFLSAGSQLVRRIRFFDENVNCHPARISKDKHQIEVVVSGQMLLQSHEYNMRPAGLEKKLSACGYWYTRRCIAMRIDNRNPVRKRRRCSQKTVRRFTRISDFEVQSGLRIFVSYTDGWRIFSDLMVIS
jgi:hypothetical protein